MRDFLDWAGLFFILYLLFYATFLFLSVTVGTSVLYQNRRREILHNELTHGYYVPVSVIVPACNEELTVADTVRSLLQSKYRLFEIVVVDDGSTDQTSGVLIEQFQMKRISRPIHRQLPCQPEEEIFQSYVGNRCITLIRKKNGGKADALNMGINASCYPYFLCMDADSILQEDALEHIVRPVLEDPNVAACGGLIRISNGITMKKGRVAACRLPKNLLVCMQILEYDRVFLASRVFLDQLNANLIISGAFGLFKKDLVLCVGGYDSSTMGEDMELVVKLHLFCRLNRIPYRIRYTPDAVCWSQAPETLKDLRSQRRRWHIGLFQSLFKHRRLFANPGYGLVSVLSYSYYLMYELLSPLIELFGMLVVVLSCCVNLVDLRFMLLFFLIYAVFGAVLSVTAFFAGIYIRHVRFCFRDAAKVLLLCLGEITVFRLILACIRLTAFVGYRDRKREWGVVRRRRGG